MGVWTRQRINMETKVLQKANWKIQKPIYLNAVLISSLLENY